MLLAHPLIDVNQQDKDGETPLYTASRHGHIEVVKVLLTHSHIDANHQNKYGKSALMHASFSGHVEVIKWLIARGRDLRNLNRKGKYWKDGQEYTALEIAKEKNHTGVVSLLERFVANPAQTRNEVCVELGVLNELVAEFYAIIIFFCDDIFRVRQQPKCDAVRFFSIAMKLPMELQMILCNRVYGSRKDSILSKHSEPAFRSLAVTASAPFSSTFSSSS